VPKVYCQGCREPATTTAVTCSKCGGRIVKECPACGFVLSAAKKYCDSCGEAQSFDDKTPAPPPAPASPPPPKEPVKKAPEEAPKGPITERKESSRYPDPVELPPMSKNEDAPKVESKAPPDLAEKPKPGSGLEDFLPRTLLRRIEDPGAPPPKKPPEEPSSGKEKQPPPRAAAPEPQKPPEEKRVSPKERFMRDLLEHEKAEKHKAREAARAKEKEKERSRDAAAVHTPAHRTVLTKISESPRAIASTILGPILLGAGIALYAYYWASRRAPERMLVTAAGTYLYALKERNVGAAYAMLAAQSRMTCSLDEFSRWQEPSEWSFDDIRIDEIEKGWARVRYKLLVSAMPVEEDWLDFVLEDKQWRRAYTWHLVPPIEADLDSGNANRARARAETGLSIDPHDPQMRGYLCEAAHLLMDTSAAERECRKTLEDIKRDPSRLDETDIFHLNSILADLYRNQLERYADAVRQYEILLAFPRLTERDRCDIGIALADTRYLAGDHAKALSDYEEAAQFCSHIEDATHIQRSRRVLSGKAGPDAVAAAQAHRMADPETGQETTLLQWRKKTRNELAKRLHKTPSASYEAEETWTAEHVEGSVYKVSVRNLGTEALAAQVDLWSHSVELR
jgi:tetratricopeptide (TPR) repeat protein